MSDALRFQAGMPGFDLAAVESKVKADPVEAAKQFEGLMIQMTLREAIARFGKDLIITATGAIEKKGRQGEVRVIFDATNGVLVNLFIRVRDQVKCPAAGDAKAVLRELHREGGSHTCIVYDISKAHRRVPVAESEWGRQACQLKGSAAAAARKSLRESASKARKEFETTGVKAVPTPPSKPQLEDPS